MLPKVSRLLSAETESMPKVLKSTFSAPKTKPKPKFGQTLAFSLTNVFSQDVSLRQTSKRQPFYDTWKALKSIFSRASAPDFTEELTIPSQPRPFPHSEPPSPPNPRPPPAPSGSAPGYWLACILSFLATVLYSGWKNLGFLEKVLRFLRFLVLLGFNVRRPDTKLWPKNSQRISQHNKPFLMPHYLEPCAVRTTA